MRLLTCNPASSRPDVCTIYTSNIVLLLNFNMRNYTELHVTQLISPHYIGSGLATRFSLCMCLCTQFRTQLL